MSVLRDEFQDPWWGEDRTLIFLAVEGARVLCELPGEPAAATAEHLYEAWLALGMAGYHLSDTMEREFRLELVDAVAGHPRDLLQSPSQRAEEALLLATDAVEGARDLLVDEPYDEELAAGLAELHRAVAALVRELGPRRAAALMLAVTENG